MMKIVVDMDESSGIFIDGLFIGTLPANSTAVEFKETDGVATLKELKSVGYTVEEILALKREGLF